MTKEQGIRLSISKNQQQSQQNPFLMELDDPLRITGEDDLGPLATGTQLAITDGDQYFIVNLDYGGHSQSHHDEQGGTAAAGEITIRGGGIGGGPSRIIFHKPQIPQDEQIAGVVESYFDGTPSNSNKDSCDESEGDDSGISSGGSGGISVIRCAAVNAEDGQQASLDHEQALAVANLLNFHNQQSQSQLYALSSPSTSTTTATSGSGGPAKDSSSSELPIMSNVECANVLTTVPEGTTTAVRFDGVVVLPNNNSNGFSGSSCNPYRKPTIGSLRTYSRKKAEKLEMNTYQSMTPSSPSSVRPTQPTPHVSTHHSLKSILTPVKSRIVLPSPSALLDSQNRKKKRCFHDVVKVIPPGEFKRQLRDTSDIVVSKFDVAPPTKKEMQQLAYSGVGKYFSHPGRRIGSVPLSKMFFSRLTMTTEPKYTATSNNKLEPLDSDLRTPGTRDVSAASIKTFEFPPTPPGQIFTEAIARKTASSFESLCKGMHKPPRLYPRHRNKASKSNSDESSGSGKKVSDVTEKTVSIVYRKGGECEIENIHVHNDPASLEDGSPQLYSEDGFIGFENRRILVKDNENDVSTESSFLPNSELDENATPNTSSIDILIAAAERENNNPSSGDKSSSQFELCTEGVVVTKEEHTSNTEIYSANDGIDQLVILGPNGERYFADFTMWG